MVNKTRRTTIKALGAAGTVAALPAWAMKDNATLMGSSATTAVARDMSQLSIELSDSADAGYQLVTLSNTGDSDLDVRHIYPGIVCSAKRSYDLNDITAHGEISIPSGGSRVYRLSALPSRPREKHLPRGMTRSRPVKVSTIERSFDVPTSVSTTRSFFV